jgi:hypothetical protein
MKEETPRGNGWDGLGVPRAQMPVKWLTPRAQMKEETPGGNGWDGLGVSRVQMPDEYLWRRIADAFDAEAQMTE